MGIYLTPVATTCSVSGHGGLSTGSTGVGGPLFERGGLPGISVSTSLAGGISLSSLCGTKSWPKPDGLVRCARCDYQVSVTAGTIFQDSRLSLTLWFRAVWWVTGQQNGVSAMGLQRVLGVKSYKTAWTLLHKLRRAMVRRGRDRLQGRVEVDEALVGGEEEGVHGRQTEAKAMIAIAAEEDGPGIGRIRIRRICDASAENLMPFVDDFIEPGSVVHTDGWLGYLPLEAKGYKHKVTFLKETAKLPRS